MIMKYTILYNNAQMLSCAKTKVSRLYLILTILYEDWLYLYIWRQLQTFNVFVRVQSIIQILIGSYETGCVCKYDQFYYDRLTLHSSQMLNHRWFMANTQRVLVLFNIFFHTSCVVFHKDKCRSERFFTIVSLSLKKSHDCPNIIWVTLIRMAKIDH